MIKLKNVSKYYYSKGLIASGLSQVNLEFQIGEFVAITGESGSGKSTLLNIISGLDAYEEGEMYINNQETSHYSEKDWEDYRRKNIGNIFQNFNLINSYTIYQNIELVLLLNGATPKSIKAQVKSLIKKVDLWKFKNTKVSKLSGGQKQRVAIARALAKDTPIIIADEPTGNLDSHSAQTIIKLLKEISQNKLVIIVTHNYDQLEPYVTRQIRMHDGKVLEDKKISAKTPPAPLASISHQSSYQDITKLNQLRLGFFNTFNILPKFLLLLAVYLFITIALITEYATFRKEEYLSSIQGYNYYFNNLDTSRIIITKKDKTPFTTEDYQAIQKLSNIESIIKNDLLLEEEVVLSNKNFYIYGITNSLDNLHEPPDLGRLPENPNEIVLEGYIDDYYLGYRGEELLNTTLSFQDIYTGKLKTLKQVKVVGIKYFESANYYDNSTTIYVDNTILNQLTFELNQHYSSIKILFQNTYYNSSNATNYFRIILNQNVPSQTVYISEELNSSCPANCCLNQSLKIETSNLYYTEELNLSIQNTYNKNTLQSLLELDDYETYNGAIFINPDDYNNLFNKDSYQSSVFVQNINNIQTTKQELSELGFEPFLIKDALVNDGTTQILTILKTIVTLVLIITLFFISYFVISIILKSRNIYFSTLRMLGATKKVSQNLLIIELLLISTFAFGSFLSIIILVKHNLLNISFITMIIDYLKLSDYILLYLIITLMSYLLSQKFSKKLFQNSAIKTYKEEV